MDKHIRYTPKQLKYLMGKGYVSINSCGFLEVREDQIEENGSYEHLNLEIAKLKAYNYITKRRMRGGVWARPKHEFKCLKN